MDNHNTIDLSIIIPVYNVEKYVSFCIDSLMCQGDLRLEIILVDDGSTDRSGIIAEEYARTDNRIKVIHQKNGGASAARNAGLDIAQGEYTAFFDSDDWIRGNALSDLLYEARKYNADVVMGNIWLCHQDGSLDQPFKQVPQDFPHFLSGKDGFRWLVKNRLYLPMPFKYIYRREYLQSIQVRFEEGIMHEDELWCPIVLYHTEKMVITDIQFYYYRQSEDSVMHTTYLVRRLKSLFRVTEGLIRFSEVFDFSTENGELKSWWYVNIYRLYTRAFTSLSKMKDSSYFVPTHHLDRFWRECGQMVPDSIQRCRDYFREAETGLRKYTDWRMSDWVAGVDYEVKAGKKVMLIFNTIDGEELRLNREDVPAGWVITTDRKYFQQATLVVFHLPSLHNELENDLDKPEGQTWVSWYSEAEENDPLITDPEINDLFDCSISVPQDGDRSDHPLLNLCRKHVNNK